MTRYVCPDCEGDLVQMLEREPWDTKLNERQTQYQNPSKHYGFYCKKCLLMFREQMYLIRDSVQSLSETAKKEE